MGVLIAIVAVGLLATALATEPFERKILQRTDVNAQQESIMGTGE